MHKATKFPWTSSSAVQHLFLWSLVVWFGPPKKQWVVRKQNAFSIVDFIITILPNPIISENITKQFLSHTQKLTQAFIFGRMWKLHETLHKSASVRRTVSGQATQKIYYTKFLSSGENQVEWKPKRSLFFTAYNTHNQVHFSNRKLCTGEKTVMFIVVIIVKWAVVWCGICNMGWRGQKPNQKLNSLLLSFWWW